MRTNLLKFCTLLCLLFVGIGNVWGQAEVYTSNVTLTKGTNAQSSNIVVSGTSYAGMKLGTGSATGTMTFKIPSGTVVVYLHAAGWNGDGDNRTLNISTSVGTLSTKKCTLINDAGVKSNTPYTLSSPSLASTSYYFEIPISGVTAEATITLTTSAKRAVVWGVNASSSTVEPEDLSCPINLSSSNVTTNSATLSWNVVSNASSYKVKIGSTEYDTNTNSYSATGLTAETEYTWSVKAIGDGTNYSSSSYSSESTFTTIAAPKHTVTWSVNGVTRTEQVAEGATIAFSNPATTEINGKVFAGWTASPLTGVQADAPVYVKSANMGTQDVTYYAVFASGTFTQAETTIELTQSDISGAYVYNGDNKTTSYKDGGFIEGWTGKYLINKYNNVCFLQIGRNEDETKSAYNAHLKLPELSGPITSIIVESTASSSSANTAKDTYLYLCDSEELGAANIDDALYGYGQFPSDNGTLTVDVTGEPTSLSIYSSKGVYMKSISVTYFGIVADLTDFCTTVPEAAEINVSAAGYTTYFNSEKAYVMPKGVEGYVAYWDYDDTNTLQVEKAYEEGDVVPEATGLVLKADQGKYWLVYTDEEGDDPDNNDLFGTDEEMSCSMGEMDDILYYYGLTLNAKRELNSVGFYWMNESGAPFLNGAHKAFLYIAQGAFGSNEEDEVKGFSFADLTTAIKNVENVEKSAKIFDMQGRQLNAVPARGMYIMNGRKYMVK